MRHHAHDRAVAEPEGRGARVLWVACAVCALISAGSRPEPVRPGAVGMRPVISPTNAYEGAAGIQIRSTHGGALWVADGVRASMQHHARGVVQLVPAPDHRHSAQLTSFPSAVQWRPPKPGLPSASIMRMVQVDDVGRPGPLHMHTTLFTDHGDLPVVSLLMDDAALLDPDTGIHVIGHAVMHPNDRMLDLFEGDGRWWKYPGNYQFRGRAWQRGAQVQILDPQGDEIVQVPTGVRIHGNITRGFPQKAFRLVLQDPLSSDLFGDGPGTEVLVLRAAGNDQPKAMLRDPLIQGLCDGLPLEVTRSMPCVVYVNGAYWGVYHLQQRIDEKELARRYGLAEKHVAMLEVEDDMLHGDPTEVGRFRTFVETLEAWDGRTAEGLAQARAGMDVDAFLTYMAVLLMVGNQDWPYHNVKFWRYTGTKGNGRPLDGRWNFILGDTDLALGAHASPQEDMLAVVQRNARWPVAAVFMALMRSPEVKQQFTARVAELHHGTLAKARMHAHLDSMTHRMAPEMQRHTARWRKPADHHAWAAEVGHVRRFVTQRQGTIDQWLGIEGMR